MQFPAPHSLPLSFATRDPIGLREAAGASAGLLWVDRPFAVTSASVLNSLLDRLAEDAEGEIHLGGLALNNVYDRILCQDSRYNLATISVDADELGQLGDSVSFHSPLRWPPRPASEGELLRVTGFPRDQWPAALSYSFRVEAVHNDHIEASLESSDMPGRLTGLCGAPAMRAGSPPEFVGIVSESMLHNQMVSVQRTAVLDDCGRLSLEQRYCA